MTLPVKYQKWRDGATAGTKVPSPCPDGRSGCCVFHHTIVRDDKDRRILTLCDALEKAILTLNFYAHHYKNMSLDKVTFKNAHGDTPDIAGMARETLKEICGEEK